MRLFFISLAFTLLPFATSANWDLSNSNINTDEIMSGGPPKDGIPALLAPKFTPGKQSDFMRPEDKVLGVVINGITKAYPIRILSWHEMVNDKFGDSAVLVSW
jgi:hypothetical protein